MAHGASEFRDKPEVVPGGVPAPPVPYQQSEYHGVCVPDSRPHLDLPFVSPVPVQSSSVGIRPGDL